MVDKNIFKKIEARLYRYYNQLKLIEKLKNKVVLLWKQKEQIEKEKVNLKYLKIDIGLNMGIDYSREKVKSSSSGIGEAEREIIKYINDLDKQLKYIIRKIVKTNSKIRELELQVQDMEFNLSMLAEENKLFVEWKYGENKSISWIANEMYGGARSTAYRKREEIIEDICKCIKIAS